MEEIEVKLLAEATERLLKSKDFNLVITEGFIDSQALTLGKSFTGSQGQIDTLKAISLLDNYLVQNMEQYKILKLQKD